MKQSLRFFSLGLLVSALLLLGYTLFFDNKANADDLSVEELTKALKEEGFHVVSEDEFIAYTLDKDRTQNTSKKENSSDKEDEKTKEDKSKKKKDDKKENKKDKKSEKEDKVVKATIKTESGVVSQNIADDLVQNKIIKKSDRDKFVKYMDSNDYSKYVQLGTFKVSNDMDFKELAETFTTYPGD